MVYADEIYLNMIQIEEYFTIWSMNLDSNALS